MKNNSIKRISFIAIFAAISSILYCYLKFNLPIFPSWLEINFSMLPIIICSFMLGPWDACVVVVLRFIVKLILAPTTTMYVGEIADLVLGLVTCISSGCIYKYSNLKNKSLVSFLAVMGVWTAVSILLNIYVNIPFYVEVFFENDWTALIRAAGDCFHIITFGAIDSVTIDNFMLYYICLGVIPFNLLLSGLVVLVTAPVHKRLKVLYDSIL